MPFTVGGTSLTLMPSSTTPAPASSLSSYGTVGATLGAAAVNVWSTVSLANKNAQMQRDLVGYNNSMRAIMQGMKQFAADSNRNSINDARVQESGQIDIAKMRDEAQLRTQAAFTGASSSAKRAAMFDVDRNAAVAKFNNESRFETALQQIQLSEYSDQVSSIQQTQGAAPSEVGYGLATATAVSGLVDKSVKSGAWDKDSSMRTYFSDLFNTNDPKLKV